MSPNARLSMDWNAPNRKIARKRTREGVPSQSFSSPSSSSNSETSPQAPSTSPGVQRISLTPSSSSSSSSSSSLIRPIIQASPQIVTDLTSSSSSRASTSAAVPPTSPSSSSVQVAPSNEAVLEQGPSKRVASERSAEQPEVEERYSINRKTYNLFRSLFKLSSPNQIQTWFAFLAANGHISSASMRSRIRPCRFRGYLYIQVASGSLILLSDEVEQPRQTHLRCSANPSQ